MVDDDVTDLELDKEVMFAAVVVGASVGILLGALLAIAITVYHGGL